VTSHIFLLFSQTIPILIATLSSVSSNNLSLFDAHFAVAVTGSPMSFYIVVSCIRYPFRREKEKQPHLFKKIPSDEAKSLICIMGGSYSHVCGFRCRLSPPSLPLPFGTVFTARGCPCRGTWSFSPSLPSPGCWI
jgi:hypothetical protein